MDTILILGGSSLSVGMNETTQQGESLTPLGSATIFSGTSYLEFVWGTFFPYCSTHPPEDIKPQKKNAAWCTLLCTTTITTTTTIKRRLGTTSDGQDTMTRGGPTIAVRPFSFSCDPSILPQQNYNIAHNSYISNLNDNIKLTTSEENWQRHQQHNNANRERTSNVLNSNSNTLL